VKLAVDANVLLSALIGGRARLILQHPQIQQLLTTESTMSEVEEYSIPLAKKRRLRPDILLLAVAALPVVVVARPEYAKSLSEAGRRISHRDPDDAELLALALHFRIPIWSNDRDFEDASIQVFTTEALLKRLGIIE
jgi:predicted nucleic acid-binding protein